MEVSRNGCAEWLTGWGGTGNWKTTRQKRLHVVLEAPSEVVSEETQAMMIDRRYDDLSSVHDGRLAPIESGSGPAKRVGVDGGLEAARSKGGLDKPEGLLQHSVRGRPVRRGRADRRQI